MGRQARGLTADAKQKISLGRGLVRPDVTAILFDEPLTVIDPHLKWELRSKLKELHRQLDITMIYVTHDQTEALTFADKVVVMHDGAVVQMGTPSELFERPAHTFVGYFIGSPGMNVMKAEVDGRPRQDRRRSRDRPAALPIAAIASTARSRSASGPNSPCSASPAPACPSTLRRIDDLGARRIARVSLAGTADRRDRARRAQPCRRRGARQLRPAPDPRLRRRRAVEGEARR